MGEDTTSNPSPEGVAVADTGFKTHNARATTAHQTPPPHLSALMLLVDNYTIMGHARKYLHLPSLRWGGKGSASPSRHHLLPL